LAATCRGLWSCEVIDRLPRRPFVAARLHRP